MITDVNPDQGVDPDPYVDIEIDIDTDIDTDVIQNTCLVHICLRAAPVYMLATWRMGWGGSSAK